MAVGQLSAEFPAIAPGARRAHIRDRVRRTVALLRRRGYALTPSGVAAICIGGALTEHDVRWAVAADPRLAFAEGLVVEGVARDGASSIRNRADGHARASTEYLPMALDFVRGLVAVAPFILSVSIGGSLASGGFRDSDDVDLNLIVEDGHRHLAYVVVNFLGILHALRHRSKPVDDLTRRPVAPRLMTVNLVLERSQCKPLARQDEDMAFELFMAEPVFGLEVLNEVVAGNPALLDHFPQLESRPATWLIDAPRKIGARWFPSWLDAPARVIGENAWRYMQWTRRKHPDALARVAYVRATMRPYTLFDNR